LLVLLRAHVAAARLNKLEHAYQFRLYFYAYFMPHDFILQDLNTKRSGTNLLKKISPSLQTRLAYYVFEDFLRVPFLCCKCSFEDPALSAPHHTSFPFAGADKDERRHFLNKLSAHVRNSLYCPWEVVIPYGQVSELLV
jgi:hypothetical protein